MSSLSCKAVRPSRGHVAIRPCLRASGLGLRAAEGLPGSTQREGAVQGPGFQTPPHFLADFSGNRTEVQVTAARPVIPGCKPLTSIVKGRVAVRELWDLPG